MKKLFSWIWSKKEKEPEYFFEPVWTPYEENERKYEARQKRERELLAKYKKHQHLQSVATAHRGV